MNSCYNNPVNGEYQEGITELDRLEKIQDSLELELNKYEEILSSMKNMNIDSSQIQIVDRNLPLGFPIIIPKRKNYHFTIPRPTIVQEIIYENNKIRYGAIKETPIFSTIEGKVIDIDYEESGRGKNITIKSHYSSIEIYYDHLDTILVNLNQIVNQKTIIGEVGVTGRVTAPHLCYSIKYEDEYINPLMIMDKNKINN